MKKSLALLLSFCMLFSLLPISALAYDDTVATLGEEKFTTLQAAIVYAIDNDVSLVTLQKGTNEHIVVKGTGDKVPDSTHPLEIDLNGKTLDGGSAVVDDGTMVTIPTDAYVSIHDGTIMGGVGTNGTPRTGGGLIIHGTATLVNVTITGNRTSSWRR